MDQAFCEVENTDPAQHQRWLDKHGFTPDADGTFPIDKFEGKNAVEPVKLLENIRANVSAGGYTPLYTVPYDERTFVMVCGGPSLAYHLEEVRSKALQPERYLVACSNMTGRYLLDNGITPHVHFIIDPQEKKRFDIAPGSTSPDTQYWINAACDPAVFEALKAQDIVPHMFLADFDSEGRAIQAVRESLLPGESGLMAIQGGTMAGLRAINLADAMGHRDFEYYGFDATVVVGDGVVKPYAYEKKRGEAVIEVQCDICQKPFDTTLIFQRQVNEFLEWRYRMPWLNFKIIGGGLVAHYLEHMEAADSKAPKSTQRFTQEYAELQRAMHKESVYGVSGKMFVPTIFHLISQLAKRLGNVGVLDYGAANGHTMDAVRDHLLIPAGVTDRCYDPFVDSMSEDPTPADLVICTDVMEHVEPEFTKAVLDHIQSLTRRIVFFSISLKKARKTLADGRNAHINLRDSEFWLKQIQKRFVIGEAKVMDNECLLVVGQAIEDVKQRMRDGHKRG